MDLNKNYIKKTIELSPGLLNKNPEGKIMHGAEGQCYVNIFLTKTCEIFEYVDVKKDSKIFTVNEQKINPYYIGLGFFSTLKRIKVNTSADLTPLMKTYLNNNYHDSIIAYSGSSIPINAWFDAVGYNQLVNDVTTIVDPITGQEIKDNGLDKLEKIQPQINSLISKAYFFPISINK